MGQVARERIERTIAALTMSPRHSATEAAAHARAGQFIAAELAAAGCAVSRQAFEMPDHPGRVGVNVIGALACEQADLSAVVVGAHYDTRPASPGADDNASGVAAMIECARALSARRLQRPVVFVAFDAEERQDPGPGLRGSSAFVAAAGGSGVPRLGPAFILEMVGFSAGRGAQKVPPGMRALFPGAALNIMRRGHSGDFLIALTRGRGKRLARALAQHSRMAGGPPVLTLGLPGWLPVPADLLRSDHAPFWRARIPAVMAGDTANFRNPNYHLPSDTPETLDYEMIAGLASALAGTVAELADEA
jgi:hypothetical protein